MAAWFDLIHRIEALEERGLTVATDYHGQGLPKWLMPALGDCDVFVLNVKGVPTDSTLCVVRLARLEQFLTQSDDGIGELLKELARQNDGELDRLLAEQGAAVDELLAEINQRDAGLLDELLKKVETDADTSW